MVEMVVVPREESSLGKQEERRYYIPYLVLSFDKYDTSPKIFAENFLKWNNTSLGRIRGGEW